MVIHFRILENVHSKLAVALNAEKFWNDIFKNPKSSLDTKYMLYLHNYVNNQNTLFRCCIVITIKGDSLCVISTCLLQTEIDSINGYMSWVFLAPSN